MFVIQSTTKWISKKTGQEHSHTSYYSHPINLGGVIFGNSFDVVDKAMQFESKVKANRIMRERFGTRTDMKVVEIESPIKPQQ